MARIAGVELPNKRAEIALTYLYGIGRAKAREILKKLDVDVNTRISDFPEDKISRLRSLLEKEYTVEGDLRSQVAGAIKRLVEINCYRGSRHRAGLPVNGQRTKTNARTRKGRGKAIANKKIAR